MKKYIVVSKSEHQTGYSIHSAVLNEKGEQTNECASINTADKAYFDTFVIGQELPK